MNIKRILYISAIWLFTCLYPALNADELTFPDKNGKIVDHGEEYKIRLIESFENEVKKYNNFAYIMGKI